MSFILTSDDLGRTEKKENVVNGVSVHIPSGAVYAVTGNDRPGREVLLDMLSGAVRPSRGTIRTSDDLKSIGVMTAEPALYPNLTALQNLNIKKTALKEAENQDMKELLHFTGLSQWEHVRVRSFSNLMRKRLGVALALVGDPGLIILQELFTGADPLAASDFGIMIRRLKEEGRTLLISGHPEENLLQHADIFGIFESGTLREEISREELMRRLRTHVVLSVDPLDKAREVLEAEGIFSYRTQEPNTVLLMERMDEADALADKLREAGAAVYAVRPAYDPLESYFASRKGGLR